MDCQKSAAESTTLEQPNHEKQTSTTETNHNPVTESASSSITGSNISATPLETTYQKVDSDKHCKSGSLKTELANNILKVIPLEIDLVTKLDKARGKWKDLNNNRHTTELTRKAANDDYLNILANVQTKVLAQYDPLKAQLKSWEENFFFENEQKEPQREDLHGCPNAYSLYKRLKLCKQLLSHWKISFHFQD